MKNDFIKMLNDFFKNNKNSYYLITDGLRYNTLLRVDDWGSEHINAGEFIYKHIGEVTDFKDHWGLVRFKADGRTYMLIGYDSELVSI